MAVLPNVDLVTRLKMVDTTFSQIEITKITKSAFIKNENISPQFSFKESHFFSSFAVKLI